MFITCESDVCKVITQELSSLLSHNCILKGKPTFLERLCTHTHTHQHRHTHWLESRQINLRDGSEDAASLP